jgi:hypothetical protein
VAAAPVTTPVSRAAAKVISGLSASIVPTSSAGRATHRRSRTSSGPDDVDGGPSMAGRELALKTKLRREVLRLLRCVGKNSGMFVQLFGLDGQRCASDGEISVALDILCGKVTARGGLYYVKVVFRFLDWSEALEREIVGLGSILICSDMRSAVARGNSVPVRVRCALNWFENHSSTPIGSLGVDIRDCQWLVSCSRWLGHCRRDQAPGACPVGRCHCLH